MASDDDPDDSHRPSAPADENIFEALHRHATEHISTVLRNTIGLPSATTRQRNGRWLDDPESPITPQVASKQQSPSHEKPDDPLPPDLPRNQREKDSLDQALVQVAMLGRDILAGLGQSHGIFSADSGSGGQSYSLSVRDREQWDFFTYLTQSTYSPLALEDQPWVGRPALTGAWRDAFEELLRTENGEPLGNHQRMQEYRHDQTWRAGQWPQQHTSFSMVPWLAKCMRLEQEHRETQGQSSRNQREPWVTPQTPLHRHHPLRLGLGPVLGNLGAGSAFGELGRPVTPDGPGQDNFDEFLEEMKKMGREAPETDLDMYERFLSQSSPSTPPQFPSVVTTEAQEESQPTSAAESKSTSVEPITSARPTKTDAKPEVLSTLTTTERTVLPDGMVSTKIVLKKRFADGREESTETVHTGRLDRAADDAKPGDKSNAENNRRGWFW